MLLTVFSAAAAYWLRLRQLRTIYDETGRIVAGAGWSFFTVFTIAMVLLYAAYAWFLRPRKKSGALVGRTLSVLLGGCGAALLMVLGSGAMLLAPEQGTDRILAVGGFVTAACWLWTALVRYRGGKPQVWLFLVPVLFFALRLVINFRFWSRDPAILDYCYALFAHISITCALLHMGSFCFDKGGRRVTVFFCLCGVFFGAASMAGARPRELCVMGGVVLWLLTNLWLLLRPGKRRQLGEAKPENA